MRKNVTLLAVFLAAFAFVASEVFAQETTPGWPMPTAPGAMQLPPLEGDPMALPRADKIVGLSVMDEARQHLGRVEDLTFSEDGRIEYLVLSRGGIFGIGARLSAIPWNAADIRIHENALIISLSKEEFERAPIFESWSELTGDDYDQKVRAYYGEKKEAEERSR